LSKWEQECFAQSSRISVLEKERNTLIDRTGALNEQLNVRSQNCDECQGRIHAAQTDISKLKSTIHGLDIEINNLEKANGMLVEEQKHKLSKNSHEYNTAHELTSALQGLEAKYYSLEVDERSKNTDLEAVNYSNQALMDRNLDLKAEYEALQKHSLLLTQQNKDLQRELDSFVETDDIVRRNLDRKEKVSMIRHKVDAAVHESGAMVVRSRSPIRPGSPLREVVEHEVRSRSPYAHYVPHPVPPPMGMGLGGPGPLRRDFSPARKENMSSYS
jgi:chromosome segregation ATPase